MKTVVKIGFYSMIFLAHVYTVYHIQYNAGFMEETILAFTVGFMNSSEYQTYLNYIFDVFYCTLIAVYFFSRWTSKESRIENDANATSSSSSSTTSSSSSPPSVLTSLDPEAQDGVTKINRVAEQQPLHQHWENQQLQQQQKPAPAQPQQQQKQDQQSIKNNNQQTNAQPNNQKSKKGAKTNKNKQANGISGSNGNKNNSNKSSHGETQNHHNNNNDNKINNAKKWSDRAKSKNSISLEDGVDADDVAAGAICGVTGSVVTGDLTFSIANITAFDVICISFVFPLSLLAIYLGWNMQTSIEISWISWRFLWGWWTERWTWWRIGCCLLAVVGITFWVKPKKIVVQGKTD